jgi:hypothetical protein
MLLVRPFDNQYFSVLFFYKLTIKSKRIDQGTLNFGCKCTLTSTYVVKTTIQNIKIKTKQSTEETKTITKQLNSALLMAVFASL